MTATSKQRAVFLDRDGVVNDVVYRDGVAGSPRSVDEFVFAGGIFEALDLLKQASFKLFVVTNQPEIARGLLTEAELARMHQILLEQLPIEEVAICRHDTSDDCACRKPRPGMLIHLATRWSIDLPGSFMVGDSFRDTGAGRAAGCHTILIDRPYNSGVHADMHVASALDAAYLMRSLVKPV